MTEQAGTRKGRGKKSDASIVLEEPSKEDGLANERASMRHGSTKSAGRSSNRHEPSNHTLSGGARSTSRGGRPGHSPRRSDGSYHGSTNLNAFSATSQTNSKFPIKPMHASHVSTNSIPNRYTYPDKDSKMQTQHMPRTGGSRGDTNTTTTCVPFSFANEALREREASAGMLEYDPI